MHAAEARSNEKLEARFEQKEKKLLEAVEKASAPPPPASEEKTYVRPSPEEHHYYYCEFPPEPEAPNQVNAVGRWSPDGHWIQGKQRDAPWRDHPNFRHNPPKGSPISLLEFKKDRTPEDTEGRVVKATDLADPRVTGPAEVSPTGQADNKRETGDTNIKAPSQATPGGNQKTRWEVISKPHSTCKSPSIYIRTETRRRSRVQFPLSVKAKDKGKEKVCGETSGEGQGDGTEKTKPYPYRGMIIRKRDATIDVASLFKDVEVKVPLLTTLKMPPISKFVKDYLAGRVTEEGRMVTEENVSTVIQRSDLPSKKTDPGMFTLLISIGDIQVEHTMCDLGASINVLPYSIYKKLGEPKLVDTEIMIQVAEKSCIHPEGILEDVIVKVNNFLYPADFFIIKMTMPAAK
ncbi:uncharacterized protein LOC121810521 [Salvia splendens]|uniref:uncharacterized protein LOC121810521 n=1 Tax=Salvia splendens TaxID=180675 RepID=UPI001C270F48|nr:uncharacterized protein LOC121810521 [Salvia splendens]